jgi:hypothetical protein
MKPDNHRPIQHPTPVLALEQGAVLKLLLTSAGVTNTSIRDALVDLLGKPFSDSTPLCIPTAQWGHPSCGPVSARGFVSGAAPWGSLTSMEWKSLAFLNCQRCLRSARSAGFHGSGRPTCCWSTAVTRRICATGCANLG